MKELKDYNYTETLIRFNSDQEYNLLVPLLNKLDSGWRKASKTYCVYKDDYRYINMKHYCFEYSDIEKEDYEIVDASDFILIKQDYYFY